MKGYSQNENIIRGAVFADHILRFVLVPIMTVMCLISLINGIPYPIAALVALMVIYYICAQTCMILIKRSYYPKRIYFIKIMADMVLLAFTIHYTGGIESPVFILLGIFFVTAVMVFPLKESIFIFFIGGAAYVGEIWLEYFRIIPHIHIFDVIKPDAFQDIAYVSVFSLVIITALTAMGVLAGHIARLLTGRFEELIKAKDYADELVSDLEKAKVYLEDKVTERTKSISESEEKYRNIVDKAFDGIYILQDNSIVFCNKRLEEIVGYSSEELKNMDFIQLVAQEHRELVRERELQRLTGEEVQETYELVAIRKDGKEINIEIFATYIDYMGRPVSQGYVKDINERKQREAELRESNDFLDSILQSSVDAIVAVDQKGIVTFASKGAQDMLGYNREDWIGSHVSKYYVEGIQVARRMERIVAENGELRNYEIDYLAMDGRKISAIVSASLMKDPHGKVIGALGVAKNMTEKKKLEDELRAAKDFLESIVESSIDGIAATDTKGNITFASKGAEEILGFDREGCKGTHISKYYVNDIDEARKIMSVLQEKGKLQNYETTLIARDGRIIPINTSASLLRDARGNVIGTLGVVKDITEKKRLEEEIRRRNEELENFVFTVSHDLKSPLVSLQGFSSILLNDYRDNLDEKGRHYLERIKKNLNHMETHILDLLELSRVGRVVGTFEEVDAMLIIEEAIVRLQHQLNEKEVELILENHFPVIYCDKKSLLQVFENLLSNSIKFMGEQGSPATEIGHEDKGKYYEFHVKDNGIGIDGNYHEKIFGIFQRLQDIKDVEGTGVGLAITKRIVENHGGTIWVESKKENGATFYFTLPKRT